MHLIHEYGLLAVAAIIGLACLGLPLPGETALLAAAIYAGTKTDLNINTVIVTGAGAAMAGRMIGYLIGHEFGSRLLLRYGHYVGLTTGRIKLGQYLFMRYGGKIIFLRTIRAGAANTGRAFRRCQSNAVAQVYVCQCNQLRSLGQRAMAMPHTGSAASSNDCRVGW
jgi:hypothetical protein